MIAGKGRTRTAVCVMLVLVVCASLITLAAGINLPKASGKNVKKDGKMVVDCSNISEGYIMVKAKKTSKRLKLQISTADAKLNYDLNSDGEYEVFPLQLGNGSYDFSLYENVSGTKYSSAGKVTIYVALEDPNLAFLAPNQYVNYVPESLTVQKSDEIAGDASPREVYDAVTKFIADEFSYDFVRAQTIPAGALPEVDPCFEKRAGICQDLAAVMVCMLRVQGVPARLMIGYADQYYHAWTVAVVDGEEIFFDPTAAIGAMRAKKYQVERYY